MYEVPHSGLPRGRGRVVLILDYESAQEKWKVTDFLLEKEEKTNN